MTSFNPSVALLIHVVTLNVMFPNFCNSNVRRPKKIILFDIIFFCIIIRLVTGVQRRSKGRAGRAVAPGATLGGRQKGKKIV